MNDILLPPPEGLNLTEIVTEQGLLNAVKNSAKKLEEAKKQGEKLDDDAIRLIIFLIGEIRRRIANLSPEEKSELETIRQQADEQAMRQTAERIFNKTNLLIAQSKDGLRVGDINKLIIKIEAMQRTCNRNKGRADYFNDCLNLLNLAKKKLVDSGAMILEELED